MHPRSPEAHSVFGTGALLLCQPSEMVRVAGVAPATSSFRTRPSAADITLKNGCQTWTRTKTSGLTGRRATLTLPGNGAAGRIPTCIVPFRRRMPHVFGHGSNLKLVSAAGFAPAITRFQAEHVGCYTTRCCPGQWLAPGAWFLWTWRPRSLEHLLHRGFGGPEGTYTLSLPADNGALC